MKLREKSKILDKEAIDRALERIAHEIVEKLKSVDDRVKLATEEFSKVDNK